MEAPKTKTPKSLINEVEVEFDIGLASIKKDFIALEKDRKRKTYRKLRVSCLFIEAMALAAIEDEAISVEYYRKLKDELRKIYAGIRVIKEVEDEKGDWDVEPGTQPGQ
jgi:hypothetical protein